MRYAHGLEEINLDPDKVRIDKDDPLSGGEDATESVDRTEGET